jgi:hypothetical protein
VRYPFTSNKVARLRHDVLERCARTFFNTILAW